VWVPEDPHFWLWSQKKPRDSADPFFAVGSIIRSELSTPSSPGCSILQLYSTIGTFLCFLSTMQSTDARVFDAQAVDLRVFGAKESLLHAFLTRRHVDARVFDAKARNLTRNHQKVKKFLFQLWIMPQNRQNRQKSRNSLKKSQKLPTHALHMPVRQKTRHV
jgi:hypothetical protein